MREVDRIFNRMMGNVGNGDSFDNYTELPYIASDGEAYIRVPYDKDTCKVDILAATWPISGSAQSLSAYFQQGLLSVLIRNNAGLYVRYNGVNKGSTWYPGSSEQFYSTTVSTYNNTITASGYNSWSMSVPYTPLPVADKDIYLFRSDDCSSLLIPVNRYTLYDENDIVTMDFISCSRKSDNELGMYDLINNRFHANDGGGSFVV